jgi:EmrB/QacA subfamily drug resistance transporter
MNKQQRLVLIISILASFVAFLDGSVVNVALPAIVRELGGGLTTQQWVLDAYLVTLGALMLVAGSLSDLFGRVRVLVWGLLGFGVASVLCAVAPGGLFLVVARGLQGVAGALLVPSSLALIISSFSGAAQGKAIGTWTVWTGIAFIIGPLFGGFLVDTYSWRLIFAINVVPIAATLYLIKSLKLAADTQKHVRVDFAGAILCALGLGGLVYALIEKAHYGWASPMIYVPLVGGLVAAAYFLWHERHTPEPMLPLGIFRNRNFGFGNLATVAIYGGLSVSTFLITVFVQQVGGYSAIEAGLAMLPPTIIMFFLSPRFGALAGKYGSRVFMSIGPLIAGVGFLSMLRLSEHIHYWSQLFPGVVLFGLGLSVTVAPLTSAVLGSIESRHAGIGSAINNAIARIAGLISIAAVGVVIGPKLGLAGFHRGVVMMAVLLAAGAVISAIGIRNSQQKPSAKGIV